MNLGLWYKLKKAKSDLNPTSQFKRELSASLSKRFDELYAPKSVFHILWVRTSRMIIAGSVGVSMIGTGAYAYTSPEVTVGTTLYPIKIGLEKIEESTKIAPEAKAKFLLKKVERREAEKETIINRVGSEVRLTFSAVVPSTSTESGFVTSSVVIVTRPLEVERANAELKNAEHELAQIENKLTKNDQKEIEIKQKIESRLSKHDRNEKEEMNIVATPTSSVQNVTSTDITVSEFDRDDNSSENKESKSFFRDRNIFNRNDNNSAKEKIKLIRSESGDYKIIDNKVEYRIYSSSTPKQIELLINTTTPVRLEVERQDQRTRRFKLDQKFQRKSEDKKSGSSSSNSEVKSSETKNEQERIRTNTRIESSFQRTRIENEVRNIITTSSIPVRFERTETAKVEDRNRTLSTTPVRIESPTSTSHDSSNTSTSKSGSDDSGKKTENNNSTASSTSSSNSDSGSSGSGKTSGSDDDDSHN